MCYREAKNGEPIMLNVDLFEGIGSATTIDLQNILDRINNDLPSLTESVNDRHRDHVTAVIYGTLEEQTAARDAYMFALSQFTGMVDIRDSVNRLADQIRSYREASYDKATEMGLIPPTK